jgi:hypothetical protein
MKKIILRRLELFNSGHWTKEETLENILELVEDYSKKFIIFADSNDITDLDILHEKFAEYYDKSTDINGRSK